jgi:hypothetical protein
VALRGPVLGPAFEGSCAASNVSRNFGDERGPQFGRLSVERVFKIPHARVEPMPGRFDREHGVAVVDVARRFKSWRPEDLLLGHGFVHFVDFPFVFLDMSDDTLYI